MRDVEDRVGDRFARRRRRPRITAICWVAWTPHAQLSDRRGAFGLTGLTPQARTRRPVTDASDEEHRDDDEHDRRAAGVEDA